MLYKIKITQAPTEAENKDEYEEVEKNGDIFEGSHNQDPSSEDDV